MTPSQSSIDAASTTWNPAFLKSVAHRDDIHTSTSSDDSWRSADAMAAPDATGWDDAKAWVMNERGRVLSLVTANATAIADNPVASDRTSRPVSTGSTSSAGSSPRHVPERDSAGRRSVLSTGTTASFLTGSTASSSHPGSTVSTAYAAALSASPGKPLKVLQQNFQRAGAEFVQGLEASILRPERLVEHVAREKMEALWAALGPLRDGAEVHCGPRDCRTFGLRAADEMTARSLVTTLAQQFPALPVDQIIQIDDWPAEEAAPPASCRTAPEAAEPAVAVDSPKSSAPLQRRVRVVGDVTLCGAFVAQHLADRHIIDLPEPKAFSLSEGESLMASACGWWIETTDEYEEPTQRLVVSADNLKEGLSRCADANGIVKKIAEILLEAARTGEMNVLESVITHAEHRLLDADARNHALCRAVVANRMDLIAPLLDRGANPAARVSLNGVHADSAFHFLANRKNPDLWRGFTDHYASILRDAGVDDTLLHAASLSGSATAVRYLLDETASRDINTRNVKGDTALHVALAAGDKRVAAVLADDPTLDLETRNARGKSYLYLALRAGDFDCARALMREGASVDHATWRLARRQHDPANATLIAQIRNAYRPNGFVAFVLWLFRLR